MPRPKKNFVVVELETNYGYGIDGGYEYKEIGQVFGPFTKEEAEEFKRAHRRDRYSSWEVKELQK